MQDTPPFDPNDADLAEIMRRVAADDAARYDVARGRRLLEAKLGNAAATRSAEVGVTSPDGPLPRPRRFSVATGTTRRWSSWSVAGVAAIAALIAMGSVLATMHRASVVTVAARVYQTRIGQRATVTLADGSRVILAPQSRLEVAPDFGDATRAVALTGEAYFTVHASAGAPFLVRTGTIETRVLGTAFDVRHYSSDTAVRIAVVTGRVAARNWNNAVRLAAGEIGLVTDSSATMAAASDMNASIAWTQGQLVFTDTPVPVLLATLSRWYGYDFQLADSVLASRYVTATFDVTKPDEAMVVLKGMLGVSLTVDGSHVTLHPRDTVHHGPAPMRRAHPTLMSPAKEIGR